MARFSGSTIPGVPGMSRINTSLYPRSRYKANPTSDHPTHASPNHRSRAYRRRRSRAGSRHPQNLLALCRVVEGGRPCNPLTPSSRLALDNDEQGMATNPIQPHGQTTAVQQDGPSLTPQQLVADYEAGPDLLRAAVAGMTAEELQLRPVAGKWSTLEVVCHVSDCEQFFADRMKRTLAMNRPLLVSADGWLYPEAVRYHDRDLGEELALVALTRRQMARVLTGVPGEAWGRTAVHTEAGLVTLRQLVLHATRHLKHHLAFIEDKRRALASAPATSPRLPGVPARGSDPHEVVKGEGRQMGVKTIRAGLEHLDVLACLFDAYRQFYGQEPDLPGARRFLEARMRGRESVVILAVPDAAPGTGVGFVQLFPSFSSVGMRPIWILNDLFVAPPARRAGVARSLLEAACELARSTGAARIRLSTAKDNEAARALYLAAGYRTVEFDQYELAVS